MTPHFDSCVLQKQIPRPAATVDPMSSSESRAQPGEDEGQQQKRARIGEGDASVKLTLKKMKALADELRQKGVRVAVLGDGQIVPVEAEAGAQDSPTKIPDGVLDSSQADCLLIVPTSDRHRYIYACAGGLLATCSGCGRCFRH
jgi:hypothetical protein